jgi:SAM-dependent methyltransferase
VAVAARNFDRSSSGPYDQLYDRCGFVFPHRPGRMVRLASGMLSPGRALDIGCGDGKDVYYLLSQSWSCDAVDISSLALSLARKRNGIFTSSDHTFTCADARECDFGCAEYSLVVCYGLFHCLDEDGVQRVLATAKRSLTRRGLLALAIFNDELPLPANHGTSHLVLRSHDHILRLFTGWTAVAVERGIIEEEHPPHIGLHRHSLSWGVFQKGL